MAMTHQDLRSHFGINNIPFGIANSTKHPQPQAVSRFQNEVIFLADLAGISTQLAAIPEGVLGEPSLNSFAALGQNVHRGIRQDLQWLINSEGLPLGSTEDIGSVRMHLPVSVGDFTDFSCSKYHNLNAGHAVTGRRGLPPTWGQIPPGYAGRCSSIKVSGTPVHRPRGHYWEDLQAAPKGEKRKVIYGPCKNMDYELELAAIIGKPIRYGESVTAKEAGHHIFGFVLLNDWTARDLQAFEMIPLGPLNSKNTATTMSPWIITYDAVSPFRTTSDSCFEASELSPHLVQKTAGALSVDLEVNVNPEVRSGKAEGRINGSVAIGTTCRCNSSVMAWTFEQLVAHQSSAGCGLNAGDLLGIGTVSEEDEGRRGCLLEDNIPAVGTAKGFLNDGDMVQLTGYCGDGVGFGECTGRLMPAVDMGRA